MASIPERLRTGSRPIDNQFDEAELLYVRCLSDHVDGGRFLPAGIKFPDWSTNRAKYSEPLDVLLPEFEHWGIAGFNVGAIPAQLKIGDSKVYAFAPIHDPTPENYSHTEVRTFKDGVYDNNLKVPTLIKKEFRTRLAAMTTIIKTPALSSLDSQL
ncbi:MAG: hypothetical protein WCT04_12405 [Planctomycetota bacterium]